MIKLQPIDTAKATRPHGHYSQAIRAGDLIFISGILGINSATTAMARPSVEEQASFCLEQIEQIAIAAGSHRELIAKITIFAASTSLWSAINTVCSSFFGDHRPARLIVPVGPLRFDSAVEMDAVAIAADAPPSGERTA